MEDPVFIDTIQKHGDAYVKEPIKFEECNC
jgi:hypothetical protein